MRSLATGDEEEEGQLDGTGSKTKKKEAGGPPRVSATMS